MFWDIEFYIWGCVVSELFLPVVHGQLLLQYMNFGGEVRMVDGVIFRPFLFCFPPLVGVWSRVMTWCRGILFLLYFIFARGIFFCLPPA